MDSALLRSRDWCMEQNKTRQEHFADAVLGDWSNTSFERLISCCSSNPWYDTAHKTVKWMSDLCYQNWVLKEPFLEFSGTQIKVEKVETDGTANTLWFHPSIWLWVITGGKLFLPLWQWEYGRYVKSFDPCGARRPTNLWVSTGEGFPAMLHSSLIVLCVD